VLRAETSCNVFWARAGSSAAARTSTTPRATAACASTHVRGQHRAACGQARTRSSLANRDASLVEVRRGWKSPRTRERSGSRRIDGTDQRSLPRAGASVAERSTYRRWFIATTVGELVAFSIPTAVWGLTAVAGLDEHWALVPVVAAGAGEGAVLGYAQTRALRRDLPALEVASWVKATAAAGALGWAVGMTPSAFYEALSELPVPFLVVLGAAGGAVLLCSIGAAQATVLRRHLHHAGRGERARLARGPAGRVPRTRRRAGAPRGGASRIRDRRRRGHGSGRRRRDGRLPSAAAAPSESRLESAASPRRTGSTREGAAVTRSRAVTKTA
jgi:hypothetical protein